MEKEQNIRLKLSALKLDKQNKVEQISELEEKEKKERKESKDSKEAFEIEEELAGKILKIHEQCQARIHYNSYQMRVLEAHCKVPEQWVPNFNPTYGSSLQGMAVFRKVIGSFLNAQPRLNALYYNMICTKLQDFAIDEVYLILKIAVAGLPKVSDSRNNDLLQERNIFVGMLSILIPYRSFELRMLEKNKYIVYVIKPIELNSYLPKGNKVRTVRPDFDKIKQLEIDVIKNRGMSTIRLLRELFSNEDSQEELEREVKQLKSLLITGIAYLDFYHGESRQDIEKDLLKAEKCGITLAIVPIICSLLSHIQELRRGAQPLIDGLVKAETLCGEIEQLKNKCQSIQKKCSNLFESQRASVKIEEFLKEKGDNASEALLAAFEAIQKLSVHMTHIPEIRSKSLSLKGKWLLRFEYLMTGYKSLKERVEQFNNCLAAYRAKIKQFKQVPRGTSAEVTTQTGSIPAPVRKGQKWVLRLPPLEITNPTVNKIERTRMEVEKERKLNQEKLKQYYRMLSDSERQAREQRVKAICLNKNIQRRFNALYSDKFGHKELETLVNALRTQGESISIDYPGNGSSHCTLNIRGNLAVTLEKFEGRSAFVEKAGTWNMQAKKRKASKNDSLPKYMLDGVRDAFQRAGYTEYALGLIRSVTSTSSSSSSLSNSISTSATLSSSSSSWVSTSATFLPGFSAQGSQSVTVSTSSTSKLSNKKGLSNSAG